MKVISRFCIEVTYVVLEGELCPNADTSAGNLFHDNQNIKPEGDTGKGCHLRAIPCLQPLAKIVEHSLGGKGNGKRNSEYR